MDPISFHLDAQSLETLDSLCTGRGLDRTTLVMDIVQRYLEQERRRRALDDPTLAALYHALEAEDLALAEAGLDEYQRLVIEADRP
jgi:metal-responsive CopG/Arc/MetJ family transcriptional regulator